MMLCPCFRLARCWRCLGAAVLLMVLAPLFGAPVAAQSPFAAGWQLVPAASRLNFQSVKQQTIVESSRFSSFSGTIGPDGSASVKVQLDSVDTTIDLRNVRMRFLFFETFRFPEATVKLRIDPAALLDLATLRRKALPVTFDLELHGISRRLTAEVVVTLLSDNMVAVASATPISIGAAEFGLADGVKRLEEAASVSIVPSGTVTFDFMFQRNAAPGPAPVVSAPGPSAAGPSTPAPSAPVPSTPVLPAVQSVAVEPSGNLSPEACAGRFEIISRTGAILFKTGSAELDPASRPLLVSLAAIVARCPGLNILIAGHTDSVGQPASNQSLSEARARSVASYLAQIGVPRGRLNSVGFGDKVPVAPNDTPWNMSRNRRIVFSVVAAG